MANKSISQLDSASTLQGTDLIEIASDQGSSTYASKSTTLSGLESFLNGNLIEDISNKFTPNSSLTFATGSPKVEIVRIGNMCFLQFFASITSGASAVGSDTLLGTLDNSILPSQNISCWCAGQGDSNQRSTIDISDGGLKTRGGNWVRFQIFWKIAV